MAIKGRATQLQQAWGAFEELDNLSDQKSERLSDTQRNKQRSLEAVAKATKIIKDKVMNDYFSRN
jgi:hypothetical protein